MFLANQARAHFAALPEGKFIGSPPFLRGKKKGKWKIGENQESGKVVELLAFDFVSVLPNNVANRTGRRLKHLPRF